MMLHSIALPLVVLAGSVLAAPPFSPSLARFNVAANGGNASSPYAYGIMNEEINYSGDGGLYAELIKNRAFQAINFTQATIAPFYAVGGSVLTLQNTTSLTSALPFSLNVATNGSGQVGFENAGFNGIHVVPQTYAGQFYIRGAYNGAVTASLVSNLTGEVFATAALPVASTKGTWTHVDYILIPTMTAPSINNSLLITFDAAKATDGSLNFNFISLFPPTYNNRPNGLRPDLMETLAGLNPSFSRLPGGSNVEGESLKIPNEGPWLWNATVGPLINRPGRYGAWTHYDTGGLGLDEWLDFCVDLDMTPILGIFSGLVLDGTILNVTQLQPYIQNTLDMLEYILGSTETQYGALRAQYGHAEPWSVRYIEFGNEDNLNGGLINYQDRYNAYFAAIKAFYPNITLVADTLEIDTPVGEMKDYHDYDTPDNLVKAYNFFDQNTTSVQTLIGEYACVYPNTASNSVNWTAGLWHHPFWIGTVSEAVFLLGAERNGDKIFGASYAPTLAVFQPPHWPMDMIYFTADPAQTILSTSYHIISLFSSIRLTSVLPVTTNSQTGPLYWVTGQNNVTGSHIAKFAVYNSTGSVPVSMGFEGVKPGTKANLTVLTAADGYSYDWLNEPNVVVTTVTEHVAEPWGFEFELPNLSVAVLVTEGIGGAEGPHHGWGGWGGKGGYGGCDSQRGWQWEGHGSPWC